VGNEGHVLTLAPQKERQEPRETPRHRITPMRKLPLVLQGFNFCTHKGAAPRPLNFTTEINNTRPFRPNVTPSIIH